MEERQTHRHRHIRQKIKNKVFIQGIIKKKEGRNQYVRNKKKEEKGQKGKKKCGFGRIHVWQG